MLQRRPNPKSSRRARRKWKAKKAPRRKPSPRQRRPKRARKRSNSFCSNCRRLEKYELEVSDLLVMWDEAQLPMGTIRIHPDGSAGSHNGAKSVISSLGTQEFARLRLGCAPDHQLSSRREYVLRPMKKAELEVAAEMIGEAGDAVEMILTQGLDAAMTKYNRRKPLEPEKPEET